MNEPSRMVPDLPIVRTMQDAVDLFRLLKEHWQLTNEFCDEVGGLTRGHTDKVLGPSEDKRLGYDTFALFMELNAIEFVPRINPDALKRMEAVWEMRERPLYPNAKVKRISKKLVERAKPLVMKQTGQLGGIIRSHLLTPKQRSDIARKGAKQKHRNARRRKRSGALGQSSAPCLDQPGLACPVKADAARGTPSANKMPAHPC